MYHASCVTADAAEADLIIVELTLNDYKGPELDITQSPSKYTSIHVAIRDHLHHFPVLI